MKAGLFNEPCRVWDAVGECRWIQRRGVEVSTRRWSLRLGWFVGRIPTWFWCGRQTYYPAHVLRLGRLALGWSKNKEAGL